MFSTMFAPILAAIRTLWWRITYVRPNAKGHELSWYISLYRIHPYGFTIRTSWLSVSHRSLESTFSEGTKASPITTVWRFFISELLPLRARRWPNLLIDRFGILERITTKFVCEKRVSRNFTTKICGCSKIYGIVTFRRRWDCMKYVSAGNRRLNH